MTQKKLNIYEYLNRKLEKVKEEISALIDEPYTFYRYWDRIIDLISECNKFLDFLEEESKKGDENLPELPPADFIKKIGLEDELLWKKEK